MRSARKTVRISALSMAAASVINAAVARAQATLNLYYGQDQNYANSNNGIIVSSTFNATGYKINGSKTNATGGLYYFQNANEQSVSETAPTTIYVPLGDYLSLSIDALLTGDPNPDAGINSSGQPGLASPAYLGLSELSLGVNSTDSTASILTPITTENPTSPLSSFNGQPTYHSTSVLNSITTASFANNDSLGPNSASGTGYNIAPNWNSISSADPRADVQPNVSGYDAGHGNGNVGLNGYNTGGNTSANPLKASGIAALEQFASSSNTANYASATDYYNSLVFQAVSAGTVILSPNVVLNSSAYWQLASHGTNATISTTSSGGTSTHSGIASRYLPHTMTYADKVNNAPNLVIVAGSQRPLITLQPVAEYGATVTDGAGTSQGTFTPASNNALMLTGGNGSYNVSEVTGINHGSGISTGNVEISGWNPTSDTEIFALDVKYNGQQTNYLEEVIRRIWGQDYYIVPGLPPPSNVTVIDNPSQELMDAVDTPTTTFNLFLMFSGSQLPGTSTDYLNIDLTSVYQDYTFSAVAVASIPEPVSLALLATCGLSLAIRRPRRQN